MFQSEDQNFHRFFQEVCERAPRALALSADGKPYTYQELWETSGCLARSLLKAGLDPGDRVGLWLPNGVEYILGLLAVSRVGAIAIPLNTRFRQDDLSFLLQHSKMAMLVCPATFLQTDYPELLQRLAPDLKPRPNGECSTSYIPSLKRILTVADTPAKPFCSFWSFLEDGKDVPAGPTEQAEQSVQPDDICILMYTSGSIATPKGVLLKHASCARKPIVLAERLKLRADDRFYTAMPLSHAAGLFSGWWLAVAVGGPLFTHSRFDARETLRTLSEEGITVERSFPTLVMDQLAVAEERTNEYDLSKLRTGLSSSLNTEVFEIAIHQHNLVPLFVQGFARLSAGVVELAGLPDHDWSGADQHDPLYILAPRHSFPYPENEKTRCAFAHLEVIRVDSWNK